MSKNEWNYKPSDAVREVLKQLNEVRVSTSALAMSQAWKNAVPKYELSGAYAALNEIVASHKAWRETILSAQSFSAMIAAAYPAVKVDVPKISQAVMTQIDTSALAALRESVSNAAFEKVDWSWLSEVYSEWDLPEDDEQEYSTEYVAEEVVTPEVCAQIESDVSQMLSNPEQAQETFQKRYAKWKEEKPFLADLYMMLLLPILVYFLCRGGDTLIARLSKDAVMYENPSAASNLIVNVSGDQNVTIIGDATNYYQVEFVNPETGETMTGYIDKENIVAEESEATEVQTEESEVTEETEATTEATELQAEVSE